MFLFFARPCAIIFGCCLSISSIAQLLPGDVVVVGYNFKDPDEFSLLSLVDLAPGTQFFITDCGWNAAAAAFRPGEGLITYTVPSSGIIAGQQIHYPVDAGFVTQGVSGFFGLSIAGDQLLIFQGSFQAPQFLFGLTDQNGSWLSPSLPLTNQSSHLPAGLTEGQSALALDQFLQARFECAFALSRREEFLSRLTDPQQWIKTSDRVNLPVLGCGFDVLSADKLEWTYKIDNDQILLFVSSLQPVPEISWKYHTTAAPFTLVCRQLHNGVYECPIPETSSELLFLKPCRADHCEPYKRINLPRKAEISWYVAGPGRVKVVMPEKTGTFSFALYLSDGSLVMKGENEQNEEGTEFIGLKPGFYILAVELQTFLYPIPIRIFE